VSVNVFANQSGRPYNANMIQSGWPDNTKLCGQGRPVTMRLSVAITERTLFDQCVVSDGGEDGAPKSKVDISSVELGRRERDQHVVTNINARFHQTTGVNVFVNQSEWPVGADTVQSGWPDNAKLYEQSRPMTMRSCVLRKCAGT
jgi:hypothetical protein